jgi:hypothetical protein
MTFQRYNAKKDTTTDRPITRSGLQCDVTTYIVTMTSFLALLRTQPCIGISMVFKPDFHPVVSRNHANGSSFFTFLRTYPQPSTRQHHITSHTHSLTQQRNYSPNNPCAGTRPWLDSLTPLTLRPRLQQ